MKTICAEPGCFVIVPKGRCEKHSKGKYIAKNKKPGDPFYSMSKWRKLRAEFLRSNPLCVDCKKAGVMTPATEVHHIEPRRERPDLAYDWLNLQAMCKSCHSKETRREEAEHAAREESAASNDPYPEWYF